MVHAPHEKLNMPFTLYLIVNGGIVAKGGRRAVTHTSVSGDAVVRGQGESSAEEVACAWISS
jgi:hypothetical protein